MDVSKWFKRLLPLLAPDEAGPRADHGVAPAHDIYSICEVVYLWMRPGNIGQANVGQVAPGVVEKLCPDGRAVVDAFLVRCVHISKRWAFI